MIKLFPLFFGLILLTACTATELAVDCSQVQRNQANGWEAFRDLKEGYCFFAPPEFSKAGWNPPKNNYLRVAHSGWNGIHPSRSGAVTINVMHREASSCTGLGISEPWINERDGNYLFVGGEVDFRFENDMPDPVTYEGQNGVPCYPATSSSAAHVLCAEKNEKRIMICINQITNNPEYANQIFQTFRWIK